MVAGPNPRPILMRTTIILSAIAGLLLATACSRGSEDTKNDALKKDTALASDLRDIAVDTSAYAATADVAMANLPDSALDRPAGPVRMRTVATTKGAPPKPVPAPAAPSRAPRSPANTTSEPCDSPATADQRRCLMAYLARSDVGLDRTYQSLIAEMKQRAGRARAAPSRMRSSGCARRNAPGWSTGTRNAVAETAGRKARSGRQYARSVWASFQASVKTSSLAPWQNSGEVDHGTPHQTRVPDRRTAQIKELFVLITHCLL